MALRGLIRVGECEKKVGSEQWEVSRGLKPGLGASALEKSKAPGAKPAPRAPGAATRPASDAYGVSLCISVS